MENIDLVEELVKLKKASKEIEEKLSALELIIFSNPELKQDERIKIVSGRKTITITEDCYERLEKVGVETSVVEKRKKKIDEFDVDVQNVILSNKENYVEKTSKESIRIK
jgi:hypothetical protein